MIRARTRTCSALAPAVIMVALAGCYRADPEVTRVLARTDSLIAASISRAEATTLASGWRADCVDDEVAATRRCYAGTFGSSMSAGQEVPFQVMFVDRVSDERRKIVLPLHVRPGLHTYPGREPLVRVDDHEPVSDMYSAELIGQLRNGRVARARYHVWPEGARDMIVDLAGFEEAYRMLIALREHR